MAVCTCCITNFRTNTEGITESPELRQQNLFRSVRMNCRDDVYAYDVQIPHALKSDCIAKTNTTNYLFNSLTLHLIRRRYRALSSGATPKHVASEFKQDLISKRCSLYFDKAF